MSSPVESGNIQGHSQYEANRGAYEKDLTKANLPQPYFFLATALAPVVRKPISANPRLNCPNPRNKFTLRSNSVPQSSISTIQGLN